MADQDYDVDQEDGLAIVTDQDGITTDVYRQDGSGWERIGPGEIGTGDQSSGSESQSDSDGGEGE